MDEPPSVVSVPSSLRGHVDEVIKKLDRLAETPASASARPRDLTDGNSVVSIFGSPGSGKSTVLAYVCHELSSDAHRLVLPTVTLERFAHGDTLFGWVLAAMSKVVKELPNATKPGRSSVDGQSMSLREHLDLLRRQEALARSEYRDSPPSGYMTPDEWAAGLAAVTTAGFRLHAGWNAFVDRLTEQSEQAGWRQIIIPVDDADQVPALVREVLRDLRWLTTHREVACLVCANESIMRSALVDTVGSEGIAGRTPRTIAGPIMIKALPVHLRTTIAELGLPARLEFTPLGAERSVIDLLSEFKVSVQGQGWMTSVADYLQTRVNKSVLPSAYAEILPELPRQLEQLWYELASLAAEPGATGRALELIATGALRRGLEPTPLDYEDVVNVLVEDSKPRIELDFGPIAFSTAAGRGVLLRGTGEGAIIVCRVEDLRGAAKGVGPDGRYNDDRHALPPSAVYAMHFVRNLSEGAVDEERPIIFGHHSRAPQPGGSNWVSSVVVDYQDGPTDNAFLPVPNWDGAYDFLVYMAGWNELFRQISRAVPHEHDSGETLTSLVVLTHFRLVVQVQRDGRVDIGELWTDDGGLDDFDSEREFEAVAEEIRELFVAVRKQRHTRAGDFDFWCQTLLLWSADPCICPPRLSHQIVQLWSELSELSGNADEARLLAVGTYSQRLMRSLSAPWIVQSLRVLGAIDQTAAEELLNAHRIARSEQSQQHEAIAQALQQRGVPSEVVGRLMLSGLTGEMEQELAGFGLPPQLIHVLAQAMPDTSPGGGKDEHQADA